MALDAELWAILYGLKLAKFRGYQHVLIETDCMVVVNMLTASTESASQPTLVRQILASTRKLNCVCFVFTKREANTVADRLVKMCAYSDKGIRINDVLNLLFLACFYNIFVN